MGASDPDGPEKPKSNWINDLAQRSTGLPGSDPPPRAEKSGDSVLWTMAGLGFQFAASTAILAYAGVYIDRRFGIAPWGVVSLVALALIANLYLLIKQSLRDETSGGGTTDQEPGSETRNRPPKGEP
jgi:F0F1-type ATP synthase assembly protein I